MASRVAKDGPDGEIFIVQARPETVSSQKQGQTMLQYHLSRPGVALVTGRAVGAAVGVGKAHVVLRTEDLPQFRPGEVLIADTTTPDWEPVMKTASALVTNRGGRTCHAAIVARELGIPAVVGTGTATTDVASGEIVTVSCAEGDIGRVYAGEQPFDVTEVDVSHRVPTRTHLMVNIGNPDQAFGVARLPVDGVGLARMEFIIAESIQAHPMALIHPEDVDDPGERAQIEDLIRNHLDGAQFFVERLSEGVGTIAAAFYPRPVVVRMSDFKTNEYASLVGGRHFEPVEANPMIGFRGASRYSHPAYRKGFDLECAAMRRVREEMGLTNVILMIPFCRRIDEAEKVLDVMAENGLVRGENGLEVYVMCEIPNNVVQVDAFSELFDGFSIGSNDLTQLILGVDRDSEMVAFDFDERDPGVMAAIGQAVEGAHRHRRHIGICGQGPSDYPEMAEALVEMGIDSMSLDPNSVMDTARRVAAVEKRMHIPA
jgi:pyruvate,water dikinase